MDICIRKLSYEFLDDYLHYFENAAFSDHREWAGCYCLHFHWESKWDSEPDFDRRQRVAEYISSDKLQGYLAYAGGEVIGWVNANDKYAFSGLVWRKDICEGDEQGQRIKSVVCYNVSPAMRGKGVATRMLNRVCEDAARDGYAYVEAYPLRQDADMYAHHHGPLALYEKCGFSVYKEQENDCIVRRYL